MIKIALFEPEIPQNTGNIARICAGTGIELILVGPLGFSISDKHVRRAGLDYWDAVKVTKVNSVDIFFKSYSQSDYDFAFLSKFADKCYTDIYNESSSKDTIIIFGNETSGLSENVHKYYFEKFYKIPMNDSIRSLNLSNSVAVVVYELLRRNNFQM